MSFHGTWEATQRENVIPYLIARGIGGLKRGKIAKGKSLVTIHRDGVSFTIIERWKPRVGKETEMRYHCMADGKTCTKSIHDDDVVMTTGLIENDTLILNLEAPYGKESVRRYLEGDEMVQVNIVNGTVTMKQRFKKIENY
ncbi:MAG: hypothetical protein GX549_03645 [Clostridiales bacterium]|nr:hypothetical protein [Clostridiales bacterium]